jgi:hypothetical protein
MAKNKPDRKHKALIFRSENYLLKRGLWPFVENICVLKFFLLQKNKLDIHNLEDLNFTQIYLRPLGKGIQSKITN